MSLPFLSWGFRPFYLLGAAWAAFAVPLWVLSYRGIAGTHGVDLIWHAHEMLFGFAPAIAAGFLLTAVRNWTGRPTASGALLAALALLWVLGRIGMLTANGWGAAVAAAFLPALLVVVARPIIGARNRRNYGVLAILTFWSVTQALYIAAVFGVIGAVWHGVAVKLVLGALALLTSLIAGRVIPAFTANAVPKAQPVQWPFIEFVALWGLAAFVVANASTAAGVLSNGITQALAAVVGTAHLIRLIGFKPWLTWRNPLLLALPLGYMWIPIHLLFFAMGEDLRATHALAVGAVGGLMLAMMTRSALGHTGRALTAGGAEILCFVLIQAAAVVRMFPEWLAWSGTLFAAAFLVFLIRYAPILIGPRADGRVE